MYIIRYTEVKRSGCREERSKKEIACPSREHMLSTKAMIWEYNPAHIEITAFQVLEILDEDSQQA